MKVKKIYSCKKIGATEYSVVFEDESGIRIVKSKTPIYDGDTVVLKDDGSVELLNEKFSFIKIILSIILQLLIFINISNATSICGNTGAVYYDDNMCSQVCSTCSKVNLKTDGTSGTCDTTKYKGFVFFNNKTYAITKNTGFWTDFTNLAMPKTKEINDILTNIVKYYNKTAWIGLYDPNHSQTFNNIDKSRFIWVDGTSLTYDNFANGEPNNSLPTEDIGVVPIYGEHWVHIYINGRWNDDGYHKKYGGNYQPKYNALVEWNGPLGCVNAYITDNNSTQTNLTDNTCNGKTPCYVCATNSGFKQCDSGIVTINYKGKQTALNQYEGSIKIYANGNIDYCFDYSTNSPGCSENGLDAIKSWIVFIGDDNKYYWLGNPDSSPICKGNLQLNTLQYTDNGNSLTISIPQGVRFVALSDVETLSGQCTGDNYYNITININPGYLCPDNRKQCTATYETPTCPAGGTFNANTGKCEAQPL